MARPLNTLGESSTRYKVIVAVMSIAIAILVALVAYILLEPEFRAQGAIALKKSILDTANQCYAIEGAYPYSLSYLEENYGLVVNSKDYVVTYEVFAENVVPNVMVVPR